MRLFREVQTLRVDEIQTEDSLEDDWTVLEVKGKESQVSLKQCPPQVPTVAPAPLAVRYKTEKPKQKVQPVMFNFNSLFKELQFAVIDQLPVDALCAAIQVCHNWQDIITNNDIWKSSYCRYFNPNSGGNSSFQRRSFEAKAWKCSVRSFLLVWYHQVETCSKILKCSAIVSPSTEIWKL